MLFTIQLCRALAAILVVLFHTAGNLAKEKYFHEAAGTLDWLFSYGGAAGVNFFFVLSGFIIHQVHYKEMGEPRKLANYVRKRTTRVYPTYWIILVLVGITALAMPSSRDTIPNDFWTIFRTLALLPQNADVVGGTGAPILIVAWTLQYEIFFYLVFALSFFSKKLFYAVCLLLLLMVAIPSLATPFGFYGAFASKYLVLLFGFGTLASAATIFKPVSRGQGPLLAGSIAVLCGIYVYAVMAHGNFKHAWVDLPFGIASAITIYALALWERKNGAPMFVKRVQSLGDSSYSLYLIHFPLVSLMSKICASVLPHNALGATISFIVIVPTCVAVAALFTRFVEAPILQWGKKRRAGSTRPVVETLGT